MRKAKSLLFVIIFIALLMINVKDEKKTMQDMEDEEVAHTEAENDEAGCGYVLNDIQLGDSYDEVMSKVEMGNLYTEKERFFKLRGKGTEKYYAELLVIVDDKLEIYLDDVTGNMVVTKISLGGDGYLDGEEISFSKLEKDLQEIHGELIAKKEMSLIRYDYGWYYAYFDNYVFFEGYENNGERKINRWGISTEEHLSERIYMYIDKEGDVIEMPVDYPVDENGKYIIDEIYWWTEGIDVYMDEVSPQSTEPFCWTQNFSDCDYDMDGLTDRVRMTREEEGTFYYVEFGNGDLLTLGPFYDPTMGFYLTGGDLTGDGVPEMLFMGMHIRVGHYYSEFIVAQKIGGEYVYMDVPKPIAQPSTDKIRYEMGYDIYVLEIDGNVATIGNPNIGISEEIEIEGSSKEVYRNFMNHWNVDGMYGSDALHARLVPYENRNALLMQIECGSRHDKFKYIELIVIYREGEWIVQNVEVKNKEQMEWWWWISL